MINKYIISSADWEYILEAKTAEEAATKAFELQYSKEGKQMKLSSVIKVVCFSDLEKTVEIEQFIDFCYTPEIISNAGFHDTAASFTNIIENENK